MDLHGKQIIAGQHSADGPPAFSGIDPSSGAELRPAFHEATQDEIDRALAAAVEARVELKHLSPFARAGFLEAVALGIEKLGDTLLHRASVETGLPMARLVSERGRTCGQLRMFAALVREGSWVGARIDHGEPDREPVPKPDLRRMSIAIGPVVVFGASNFPLAFSVAGGDSVAAWAAGCPVVVKGHPNHPGASELVGEVVRQVTFDCGLPGGTFSLLQGREIATGAALVRHPSTQAVGFTGSLAGGRALFDIAAARPQPIPVFAEMGSTNPVFLLPGALAGPGAARLAAAVHTSVTTGVGQFCTNPGLLVALRGDATDAFRSELAERMSATAAGTMLHAGIRASFGSGIARVRATSGVREWTPEHAAEPESAADCTAHAALFSTGAETWLSTPHLADEVFGPSTILIECDDLAAMHRVADNLHGQLTAAIHGTPSELDEQRELLGKLEDVAGRVILNGLPTGVEVCPSMQHGGPYPATTDCRTTSVGTSSIQRFARPVAFQNTPEELLPDELKEDNPMGILRLVDGEWTRGPGRQ